MVLFNTLIIPRFFTEGTGDPEYYFQIASRIAHAGLISEIRPFGQGPIGLGAILISVMGGKIGIIFFNATIHTCSIYFLIKLLRRWFDLLPSVIASLLLAISPYMMLWYAQLNKESLVLLGAILFCYGFTSLMVQKKMSIGVLVGCMLAIALSILMFWFMRPYLNQILLPIVIWYTLLISYENYPNWFGVFRSILIGFGFIFALGLLPSGGASDATLSSLEHNSEALQSAASVASGGVYKECVDAIDDGVWGGGSKLQIFIGSKMRSLMGRRCLIFSGVGETSNVNKERAYFDEEFLPKNIEEAFRYLPIGGLKGVFYPPLNVSYDAIINSAPSPFYLTTFLYQIFFLAALVGILFSANKKGIFPIICLCLYIAFLYGVSTPFIGALVRYRYPWYMIITSIGIAALIQRVFNSYQCITYSKNKIK